MRRDKWYWLPQWSRAEYLPFNSKVTDLRTFGLKHHIVHYNFLINQSLDVHFKMHTFTIKQAVNLSMKLESIKLLLQVKFLSKIGWLPEYEKSNETLTCPDIYCKLCLAAYEVKYLLPHRGQFFTGICFLAFLPLLDISVVECFGCWFGN